MRKILLALLLLLLPLTGTLAYTLSTDDAGFTLMAETAHRALLLDEKTLNVRVVDIDTGESWDAVAMNGQKGNKTIKNNQKSALNLTYIVNAKNSTTATMDSYSSAVTPKTFAVEPVDNGFEIHYTIGDDTMIIDDLPKAISMDKYNNLLENAGWTSKEEKTMDGNYRAVKLAGMEQEIMIRAKDDSLSVLLIKQLHGLIFGSGLYTEEDMIADNALVDYERTYLPEHQVILRYQLVGDDLVVTLPAGELISTPDNEITQIDWMPYFLSADDTKDGFMLLPDGSGALIYLNNQKLSATSYAGKVYGQDVLINSNTYAVPRVNIALPVVGLKRGDAGILAIIEKGAEIATLTADISGRADEFNRLGMRFTLREIENVSLAGNDSITTARVAEDVYAGDIVVRYKLLNQDEATFVGMAKTYRSYLIAQGILTPRVAEEKAPFYLELLGAAEKDKFFLGIPYTSSVQATTLAQAQTVYQAVRDAGVRNIRLIYSGLFKGGIKHTALTRPALDSGMGTKDDLKALQEKLAENGDALYAGVYLGRAYGERGFNRLSEASRRHDGEPAKVPVFAESIMKLFRTKHPGYLVSPHYLPEYVDKSIAKLESYGFDGLNIFDLGNTLTPDFKRRNHLSRIHATPIYQDALRTLETAYPLILDTPFLYALPYAKAATNLPQGDNGFKLTDASVPFLQYVLQGTMELSGTSWNLHAYDGLQTSLLWAMESLQAPRFTLTYEPPTLFQNTNDQDYLAYFTTQYQDWTAACGDMYAQYDAFYQQVRQAQVQKHEIISDTLRRVTFDNGVVLVLNYGTAPGKVAGETIPPQSYRIHQGVLP